jgi:hypothetical protein
MPRAVLSIGLTLLWVGAASRWGGRRSVALRCWGRRRVVRVRSRRCSILRVGRGRSIIRRVVRRGNIEACIWRSGILWIGGVVRRGL